nr:ATP-binding cassette domain-containing protein [Bifidobacterium pullorum]
MLTLSHIDFTYPGTPEPLFEDISVSFPQGWTAVLGDNGIGKSTLAAIATGRLAPDAGIPGHRRAHLARRGPDRRHLRTEPDIRAQARRPSQRDRGQRLSGRLYAGQRPAAGQR